MQPLPYPDEAGLSVDSLRGSEQHIRPDLIGSTATNPFTGGVVSREPLTYHEAYALAQTGVDVSGFEFQTNPDDLPAIIKGPDSAPSGTVPPEVTPSPLPQPGVPASPTVNNPATPEGTRVGPDGEPMVPERAGTVNPANLPGNPDDERAADEATKND